MDTAQRIAALEEQLAKLVASRDGDAAIDSECAPARPKETGFFSFSPKKPSPFGRECAPARPKETGFFSFSTCRHCRETMREVRGRGLMCFCEAAKREQAEKPSPFDSACAPARPKETGFFPFSTCRHCGETMREVRGRGLMCLCEAAQAEKPSGFEAL